MRKSTITLAALVSTATLLAVSSPATGQVPPSATDLPVLSRQVPRGALEAIAEPGSVPTSKMVDGDISDWVGTSTMFGGTAVYSAGEYVYQDHLFDAHGPDDGRDASRLEKTDPIEALVPEAYRIDAASQADLAGELGVPIPEEYQYDGSIGDVDGGSVGAADLLEVRLAAQEPGIALLARTTTMDDESGTALLVLIDDDGETGTPADVGFNSGLASERADRAFFLTGNGGYVADLATGDIGELPEGWVATDPSGYVNSIEALLPAAGEVFTIAVATGTANAEGNGFAHLPLEMNDETAHPNIANVAFRFDEPVRSWFDRRQGLELRMGSIDGFFDEIDANRLIAGENESFQPGPGYHDRIFVSTEEVANESNRDGLYQHYGLYLPESYDGSTPSALQYWLHWRGGNAHTAAAVAPRIFKHFGEDVDSVVVSPSGRGTSRWYVGKGHVDFLQVWADVLEAVSVDEDRVYVTGHSMGGWGSYLLTLLYPDRFAAAAPVAGPVTQGAWTGVDYPGCDGHQFDDYTPCYISANGSRPRHQHTRRLLENSRHVPYAILHGNADELVPWSGVARQVERLVELGYRHRFYTYPGHEHYTHPIMDQWSEAAAYLHTFSRPVNPAHVTYKRDMLFELATEEVASDGVPLDFNFDSAYWMSGLTPVDAAEGVASFDGRSLAIPAAPYLIVPEAGGPTGVGTTGPYVMEGLAWLDDPTGSAPATSNGFDATLTGASSVALDLTRMAITTGDTVTGTVDTSEALTLSLLGDWTEAPQVLVGGDAVHVDYVDGLATFDLPEGVSSIEVV